MKLRGERRESAGDAKEDRDKREKENKTKKSPDGQGEGGQGDDEEVEDRKKRQEADGRDGEAERNEDNEDAEISRALLPEDVLRSSQLLARYALRPAAVSRQDLFRGVVAFLFSADHPRDRGRDDEEAQESRCLRVGDKGLSNSTLTFNSLADIIR